MLPKEESDSHSAPSTEGINKAVAGVDAAVGGRIYARRRQINMSAKRLGELVGVSSTQIANYETGARRIGAARLYAISLALDVPVSFFFSDMVSGRSSRLKPTAEPMDKVADEPAMGTILRLGKLAANIEDPRMREALRDLLRRLPPSHLEAEE
jgi:transcriptional regulator with XRE-family HTH domain